VIPRMSRRCAIGFLFIVAAFPGPHALAAEPDGAMAQEAVSLLVDYIRVDTTNPPGNEIRAAEFFKAIFDREGIESQIFESAPGRASIYARLKGDGSKKDIVLMNHMDVVPVDQRYWTVDPFAGVIKDGYIYGRGALDMKSMGILELMAFLTLKRERTPLKSDVIFLGTADEEAGGMLGAGYMVKEHFDLFANAGTVLNEFGLIPLDDSGKVRYYGAYRTEKTPFWLKLTATGTSGHGSAPRPDSAVIRLIEALHRIVAYQTPLKVDQGVQDFYADTAELEPDATKRARLKDLRNSIKDPAFAAEFTKDRWSNAVVRNTIAITMLEGSNKVNVIPPEASARLDVRLLPSQKPDEFLDELKKVIADDTIKVEPILSFPPSSSPRDSEFFRVLEAVAAANDPGVKVTTPMLTGFTDCHFFREKGIPCFGFIPLKVNVKELAGIHGNDERLPVDTLGFGTRVMHEVVRRLATQ
jgi:acetylornithine deacetylase/succinyl-diaminopimelate desuccinylase-like protein